MLSSSLAPLQSVLNVAARFIFRKISQVVSLLSSKLSSCFPVSLLSKGLKFLQWPTRPYTIHSHIIFLITSRIFQISLLPQLFFTPVVLSCYFETVILLCRVLLSCLKSFAVTIFSAWNALKYPHCISCLLQFLIKNHLLIEAYQLLF